MKKVSSFELPLRGVSLGNQKFEYHLDDAFFTRLEASDVLSADVNVVLDVVNHGNGIVDLKFAFSGKIGIVCDRCLEEMPLDIDTSYEVSVKTGEEFDDSDDEVIIVTETQASLDLAPMMRDTVLLAIPAMHTHAEGECNSEMMRLLAEHKAAVGDDDLMATHDEEENDATDPRWEALRKLKDNNN